MTFHRASGKRDLEDLNRIWSWVYRNEPPTEPMSPEEGESYFLVRNEAGEAVSVCQIYDYQMTRGDAVLPCGGIGGVATPIEHRGTGAASALMRGCLRQMREAGQVISALYGFRETYYRRFGYEMCGWRWQISTPVGRLPKFEKSLPVRQIDPKDVAVLDDVYRAMARTVSGFHLRTKADWESRLGKKPPPIYAVGDPIEGYAWVTLKDFWGTADVGEIGWSSRRGYESIMAVLRDACHNQSTLKWQESPASPFIALWADQGATCEMARWSMFRVVDVPGALRLLKPEGEGSFCIDVLDAEVPENSGPWQVEWSGGSVQVIQGGTPDLMCDIRPFSQALMGQPSLAELVRHEAVKVLRPEALTAACQLLSPMPVMCSEFF